MVEQPCLVGATETVEQRHFINAIPTQAKRFADAVRSLRGAENRQHRRVNVLSRKDANHICKDHTPAIMATIRHLAMNLRAQEASNLRVPQRRRKVDWNDDCRAKVVFGK